MNYEIDNWRANMILEALHTLDEKWQAVINSTDDEDVKADYGNDLIRLHILQESFERDAVEAFGPGIADFSREPQNIAPPASEQHAPTNGQARR